MQYLAFYIIIKSPAYSDCHHEIRAPICGKDSLLFTGKVMFGDQISVLQRKQGKEVLLSSGPAVLCFKVV